MSSDLKYKPRPELMVLTPRYSGDEFQGYDAVASNIEYLQPGALYAVVGVADYNRLKTQFDCALTALKTYASDEGDGKKN